MNKVAIRNWNYYPELRKTKPILVAVIANHVVLIDLNIETDYSVVFISVRAKDFHKQENSGSLTRKPQISDVL